MAKKISDYILLERNTRKQWVVPKEGEKYSLTGTCKEKAIYIPEISIVKGNIAISSAGEEFLLSKMQKDYKNFFDAIKNNIPVIDTWNIKGSKEKGYQIIGYCDGVLTKIKVEKQIGNFILNDKKQVFFVMWNQYSPEFENKMFDCSIAAEDIKFNEMFEWFGESQCRPIIPQREPQCRPIIPLE